MCLLFPQLTCVPVSATITPLVVIKRMKVISMKKVSIFLEKSPLPIHVDFSQLNIIESLIEASPLGFAVIWLVTGCKKKGDKTGSSELSQDRERFFCFCLRL